VDNYYEEVYCLTLLQPRKGDYNDLLPNDIAAPYLKKQRLQKNKKAL
jgi:hypothetical protein